MQIIDTLEAIPAIMAYFNRIGAKPRGINYGVVEVDRSRYWVETAVIRISKDEGPTKGDVEIHHSAEPDQFRPTDEEQRAIKAALENWRWPRHVCVPRLDGTEPWAKHPNEGVYEFRNADGLISMVQVRTRTNHRRMEGQEEKRYVPWSKWDDGKWRAALPSEKLPIYNEHLIVKGKPSIIILHEGAKAAQAVHNMVTGEGRPEKAALLAHPWGMELSAGVNAGWIGGALAPHRTDWGVINRAAPEKVIIVCDNDYDGRAAAARIARYLTVPTVALQFDDKYPPGFDLADQFPEALFSEKEGVRYYQGGAFWDHCHPTTWATERYEVTGGRPGWKLRDAFKRQWVYVEQPDAYVNSVNPNRLYPSSKIARIIGHLSDTTEITDKLKMEITQKVFRPTYVPYPIGQDVESRAIQQEKHLCWNTYMPTRLKPVKGDVGPWLEYIRHLVPKPQEAHQLLRWCATIIAHPERRIKWHTLLISPPGTGKSTLGELFMRPIVGSHNVGLVTTQAIFEGRNSWAYGKKLVLCHELYTGNNKRVADALKSPLTDPTIFVNEKYIAEYECEVCFQMLACSNSEKAVLLEEGDRRWFVPTVSSKKFGEEKFASLYSWARSGGISNVFWWALNDWDDYCTEAEEAPETDQKREAAEDAKSDLLKVAEMIAGRMGSIDGPAAIKANELCMRLRTEYTKCSDSNLQIRRAMTGTGALVELGKINLGGGADYIIANNQMVDALEKERNGYGEEFFKARNGGNKKGDDWLSPAAKIIRPHLKTSADVMPSKNEKGM